MKPRSKVDEVLAVVRPPEREAECRKAILLALRTIESAPTDPTTPGQRRKALRDYATALRKAKAAIAGLDQTGLLTEDQLSHAAQIAMQRADLIDVKRSGGSTAERALAVRKRLAVEQAFDLLMYWGRRNPTMTKDNKAAEFLDLSALLLKLACGQKRTADLERVCKEFFAKLEADGYPDAASRKRFRIPPIGDVPDFMKPTNNKK